MDNYQSLWDQTKEQIKMQLGEDNDLYISLFSNTKTALKCLNGSIYILCPDELTKTKLNMMFVQRLQEILETLTTEMYKYKFVTADEVIKEQANNEEEEKKKPRLFQSNLNSNYTFDSFVVGDSNMMSYRYAMQVADQGAFIANPLYIFGDVGLGKTHLMQAIGNYIIDKDINKKVLYIESQKFIEDYSKACQKGTLDEFAKTYQELDALLVDDIQMLSLGKKSQQEFFKVFNDLYANKKIIVMTSDKPANQLKDIMDRLTSRFSWGMQVDNGKPSLEHRVNILKRKLKQYDEKVVPEEVLTYIASNYTSNIRELESGLRRVIAYAVTFNTDITLEEAKEALEAVLKNHKQTGDTDNYEKIQSVVCSLYNIDVTDLIGTKRNSKYILPRHICMYLLKSKYDLPYKKIGFIMGGKDHTTVISACEKIELALKYDKELKLAIDTILKKIE